MTFDEIRSLVRTFQYNPDTGVFVWKVNAPPRGRKGKSAGFVYRNGYVYLSCRGKRYLAHRIAWLFTYGEIPLLGLDHINGNPIDNRIGNLRIASQSENMRNRDKQKNNTSGFKGVHWCQERALWTASIQHKGKMIFIGRYEDIFEAAVNYNKASLKLHGDYGRLNESVFL